MKTFLQNLEEELKKNNLKTEEIEEIIADHSEMIESAIKEGLSDEDLEEKFGNPKDLADELSQFTEKDAKEEKSNVKVLEFNGVKEGYSIAIGLVNEDIEFIFNDDNKIIVEYKGRRSLKDYEITFEKNIFVLKSPRNFGKLNFFNRVENGGFKISIPEGVAIDSFKLKEVNGDISLESITVNEFVTETTNGDVSLNELSLGTFKTSTINGDMKLTNISCDNYSASMISGNVAIEGLKCEKDVRINTVSGDIQIKDSSCEDASLKTVSGDLNGKEFYPKTLSLSSVSGDIKIVNKDSTRSIQLKHKRSVSGDIDIITK